MDTLSETIRKDFVSITNFMIRKQHLRCNWSSTLKGLGQIVQGKSVKKGSGNDRFTFLVPSLTKSTFHHKLSKCINFQVEIQDYKSPRLGGFGNRNSAYCGEK